MVTLKKIFNYTHNGEINKLESLISDGSFVSTRLILQSSKDSILHIAIRTGNIDIVKCLLENGCEIFLEHQNNDGKRPLHEAALLPSPDILSYLLKCGVEIDPLKRADWTPLMLAAAKGHLPLIKILIENSASVYLQNKDGWTPFHIACRDASIEVIEYFFSLKENIWDSKSKNGRTPLHTAALQGRTSIVELLLLKANYSEDETDSCGNTPLMDAVRSGHTECARIFLSKNFKSVGKMDHIGRLPIHLAAEAGQDKIIQTLVDEYSVKVDSLSKNGETPLHFASWENKTSTVTLLASMGADINHQDMKGRTALWKAASAKKMQTYKTLISLGAKDTPDQNMKKPSELLQ